MLHRLCFPSFFINMLHRLCFPSSFINMLHRLCFPSSVIKMLHRSCFASSVTKMLHHLCGACFLITVLYGQFCLFPVHVAPPVCCPFPYKSVALSLPFLFHEQNTALPSFPALLQNVAPPSYGPFSCQNVASRVFLIRSCTTSVQPVYSSVCCAYRGSVMLLFLCRWG